MWPDPTSRFSHNVRTVALLVSLAVAGYFLWSLRDPPGAAGRRPRLPRLRLVESPRGGGVGPGPGGPGPGPRQCPDPRRGPPPGPPGPGHREVERYVRQFFVHDRRGTVTVPINMQHVVGVEVSKAWVGRGEFLVDTHNNCLDVECAGQVISYRIPPGDTYVLAQDRVMDGARVVAVPIQERLQCGIRAAGRGRGPGGSDLLADLEVQLITRQHRVRFTSAAHPFRLLFGTGPGTVDTVAPLVGFPVEDKASEHTTVSGAAAHRATGTLRADLAGPRFIDIRTRELEDEHTDGVLAQIPVYPDRVRHGDEVNLNLGATVYAPEAVDVRTFQRPRRVGRLTLSFTTFDHGRSARRTDALAATREARVAIRSADDDVGRHAAPEEATAAFVAWHGGYTGGTGGTGEDDDDGGGVLADAACAALPDHPRTLVRALARRAHYRGVVARHAPVIEDPRYDPYRPIKFNGLAYDLTISVYSMRWKIPFKHNYERMR